MIAEPRIDVASGVARQQIASFQKVISMQQKENSTLQEQVNLLETEVEEMKTSLHKQQKQLNTANDSLAERDEKIQSLEEKLKVALIERKAFEKFSNQNKMLLDKYLVEQKESERQAVELTHIREDAENLRAAIEDKAKSLTEKEIEYTSQIRGLQDNLKAEKREKTLMKDTLEMQRARIDKLQQALAAQIELRAEELARSRQSEYKTMMRADSAEIMLQKTKDDNEIIADALKLSTFQSGTLKGRLSEAMDKAEQSDSLLHTFVTKAEESSNLSRAQERRLRKENETLQNKVVSMTLSLRDSKERVLYLEQRLDKALQPPKSKRKGGAKTANFADAMSYTLTLPHAGVPTQGGLHLSKARTTGAIRVDMSRPKSAGNYAHQDDANDDEGSCDSGSVLYPPGFSSSLDATTKSDTLAQSSRSESEGMLNGLDQPSSSLMLSDVEGGSSALLPQDDCMSAFETVQYQGKRCLLAKHMRHVVSIYNTLAVPTSLKGEVMDLSRCAVNDDDMAQVIDWWRLMPVKDISLIDLRSNMLTAKGCTLITAWVLSLSKSDLLDRVEPLHINCQFNMIDDQAGPNIVAQILRAPQPDIKLVDFEDEGRVVVVYGSRQTSQRKGSAILRWSL